MSTQQYTPQEYETALAEAVDPIMTVRKWRALKGLVYALIITANAMIGVIEGAWIVPVTSILAIMLVFGIEISEIQIADYLSIRFRGDWSMPGGDDEE